MRRTLGGGWLAVALFCSLAGNHKSFVDTASLQKPQDGEETSAISSKDKETQQQLQDSNVRELESLKHSLGKTLEMMKAQSAEFSLDSHGHQKLHSDTRGEVNENGKLLARVNLEVESEKSGYESEPISQVKTEVEIPEKGIHKTISKETGHETVITENGNRRSLQQNVDFDTNNLNKYSGVQYSPLDMAEYVFWTGDEKGVTLAIEEFLQDGLMTREEAIVFLQQIKYNLDYLQSTYSKLEPRLHETTKERTNIIQKYMSANKPQDNERMLNEDRTQYDLADLRQDVNKKSEINENQEMDLSKREQSSEDEDYEELLEKLRLADFLYTEYSLEEIIYQLSKIMFAQSLQRGSAEAQGALQKFTGFLEKEAEAGHISRALEKKVLDVLIAALTDTLSEHPELVPAAREGLGGGISSFPDSSLLLQKLFEMDSVDKSAFKSVLMSPYRLQRTNKRGIKRPVLAESQISKSTPIGLGKYKTP